MRSSSFALLIEPNHDAATAFGKLLVQHSIENAVAASGPESWEALALRRPDLVLAELHTPGLDVFFRRLRDEYMGVRPLLVALGHSEELAPEVAAYDLDAVIIKPIGSTMIQTLIESTTTATITLDRARMREMVRVSSLGSELQTELNAVAQRLVLAYGVQSCVVLATASERQWVGTVGDPIPADRWPALWDRCDQAVSAGAPLLCHGEPRPDGAENIETILGAPIRAPNGTVVGAICLFSDGPRLYEAEARDALFDLADRVGRELSWRSVHDRVAAERDRLRENALLDPMLGIMSRAALEQAVATEIARNQRTAESLCIAVMDVTGLRHINDRYGHVAGDTALKHVATVTRRLIRAQDIVARYGGDEMAIVLPSTTLPGATALLERLRKAVETEPVVAGDQKINLRVAIGVTEYNGEGDDAANMLARAMSTACVTSGRGGTIAIADKVSPSEDTRPGIQLDRFEAGVTLGGVYQIVHEISRGAMGVVYRAEDLGLSRPVAIKMLRPDLTNDSELVQRFRAEAGVLASLNHENLVRVYAFVEDKDDVFFVMELVEGVSLDDVINEEAEGDHFLAPERVVTIVSQVSSALDAMHDAGLMHRDVKPGNVVLDRARNRAVLVDVGLAKRMGTRAKPAGTPGFIAPESFRGGQETPAGDVYGLAATTYSLLTGRAPFGRADNYKEILQRQLDERPPAPSSYRTDLTVEVDQLILSAMEVDPSLRPATAGEFAATLARALLDARPHSAPTQAEIEVVVSDSAPSIPQLESSPEVEVQKRTLTLNFDLVPPGLSGSQEPMTRGVVFRGAARLLGLRTASSWMRILSRKNSKLADALSLRTAPLSWLPSQQFLDLLSAAEASGRNPDTFARELATSVVEQTFQRFYPSSPESLSPRNTLSAIDILWRRYHTWGKFNVTRLSSRSAEFEFTGPCGVGVSAFIEGWLEGVVSQAGGKRPRAKTNQEEANRSVFQVYWGG